MNDVTFMIPVYYDHPDRYENLELNLKELSNYNSEIIICENKSLRFKELARKYNTLYTHTEFGYFHRTKMLNIMSRESSNNIIVNWDADVFCFSSQLKAARNMILEGCDLVYPYAGKMARVPRKYKDIVETELESLQLHTFKGTGKNDEDSTGGAIFYNKKSFISGGMENERMISYSPDDRERYWRFKLLGYKVDRTDGIIYHLDHHISIDSSMSHPKFKDNWQEFEKEKKMSKQELIKYISTWEWL